MNEANLGTRGSREADAWNSMSLWEKCWVVMCALDDSADLRLEQRVQNLERQVIELQRNASGTK